MRRRGRVHSHKFRAPFPLKQANHTTVVTRKYELQYAGVVRNGIVISINGTVINDLIEDVIELLLLLRLLLYVVTITNQQKTKNSMVW